MLSHHIWSRSRISRIIIYAIVATTIILISAAGSNAAVFSSAKSKRSVRRSSPPPVVTCATQPSGLVSWWPGDGNAFDIKGGNNGTPQNGVTFSTGKVGQAVSFNGVNQYVSLSNVDFRSNTPASMGFWVQTTDAGAPTTYGNLKGAFFGRGNSVDQHLHLGIASGKLTIEWYLSGHHSIQGTSNIADGNWHHVVFVSNGAGTVSLYVDGILENSGTFFHTSGSTSTRFGSEYEGNGSYSYFYNGLIDEVEYFNRAISLTEIQAIFNAGSAGICRSCTPPPSGMVSWWSGENNTLDNQGRNNAALMNSATYAPGMVGQAFSLDGSDDYAQVPHSPSLDITGAISMDAWIKTNAPDDGVIMIKGDPNCQVGTCSYGMAINPDGTLFMIMYGSGVDWCYSDPGIISPNQWYHVAATWDGTTGNSDNVKLYVNGTIAKSCTKTTALNSNSQPLIIGSHGSSFGRQFNGLIDEPAIYDRALSNSEMQSIYNAGSAGRCNSCTPAPVGLVSWWNGNGNALDARSRNDGTLENGAVYAGGKVGQAFDLGGTGQRVLVGNPASLQLQDFTIETWIKRSSATVLTNNPVPASPGGAVFAYGTGGYGIGMREATNTVFLTAVGVSYVESPTMPITDTNFHHVAVTKTGNQVVFYVDGNASPPITYNVNFGFSTSAAIGARGDADVQNSFFGVVDDLSIYNRALSAAEVRSVANANGSGKCKPTATTPPAGVVGWWGGDGFVSDISGNANHATLINGAGFAVGKVGQGFKLSGASGSGVTIPHNTLFDINPTGFTAEFWMKSNGAQGEDLSALLEKSHGWIDSTGWAFHTFQNSNDLHFAVGYGGVCCSSFSEVISSGISMLDGNYHHVVGTWDGNNMRLYVDGILQGTAPIAAPANNTRSVNIGYTWGNGTPQRFFNGVVDEVSIYNRAITQTEIQSIVNAGLAGKLKQTPTSAPAQLAKGRKMRTANDVGIYAFDGDATILFPAVTASGMTHEIPLDPVVLPPLPLRTVGLTYDIATSARYTGTLTVCFNLPSFTTTEFATLHILHLENGGWVDVTYASSAYPSLCALNLTSLSPFAIVTTAPTAAELSIAGRVVTAGGRGIRGAFVTVTGTGGDVRNVPTGNLGRYIVTGLTAGETYVVTVRSRRFFFDQPSRVITLNDNVTDADFIGSSGTNREQ